MEQMSAIAQMTIEELTDRGEQIIAERHRRQEEEEARRQREYEEAVQSGWAKVRELVESLLPPAVHPYVKYPKGYMPQAWQSLTIDIPGYAPIGFSVNVKDRKLDTNGRDNTFEVPTRYKVVRSSIEDAFEVAIDYSGPRRVGTIEEALALAYEAWLTRAKAEQEAAEKTEELKKQIEEDKRIEAKLQEERQMRLAIPDYEKMAEELLNTNPLKSIAASLLVIAERIGYIG